MRADIETAKLPSPLTDVGEKMNYFQGGFVDLHSISTANGFYLDDPSCRF